MKKQYKKSLKKAMPTTTGVKRRTRAELLTDMRHNISRGLEYKELREYIYKKLRAAELRDNPDGVHRYRFKQALDTSAEYFFAQWLCTHLWLVTEDDRKAHGITPSEHDTYATVCPFDQLFTDYQNLIFPGSSDDTLYSQFVEFIERTELMEVVGGDTRYWERHCRRLIVRVPEELKQVLKAMPIGPRKVRAKHTSTALKPRVRDDLTDYVTPQEVDIQAMRAHIIDNLHLYGVKKLISFTNVALRIQSGDLVLNTAKTGRAYFNIQNLPKGVRNALFRGKFEIDISSAHATIFNKLTDSKSDVAGVYERVSDKLKISRSESKILVNSLLNMMRINTARRKIAEWGGRHDELLNCPEIRQILDTRSHAVASRLQRIESDCMRSAIKSLGYITHHLHDAVVLKSEADCVLFHKYLNVAAGTKFGIHFNTKIKELK